MKAAILFCLVALCIGCARDSKSEALTVDPQPTNQAREKLRAFELIVAEFEELPTADEFFTPRSEADQEKLIGAVRQRADRIDGMLAVFQLMSFEPSKQMEIAKQIAAIYGKRVDTDQRNCVPYRVIVEKITDAIIPILELARSDHP
jgi:hypothetical protein